MRSMMIHIRPSVLIVALVACILIGFIAPRPSFLSKDLAFDMPLMTTASNEIVQVEFYGESLCPDCQHMVLDILDPLFKNGISKLFRLNYIAYGNVREKEDGTIACQHGNRECYYNRWINCVQKATAYDQDTWFPAVKCLAENLGKIADRAADCAGAAGLKADAVTKCVEGEEGKGLEQQAALETKALEPKHTFVPWITVNGVAIGADFENVDRYVCAASSPIARPEACSQLPDHLKTMG